MNGIVADLDRWKGQYRFLDSRGERQQIHDLGHSSAADLCQPRDISLIIYHAVPDQLLEPDRQRHQPRDPWNATRRWFGFTAPGSRALVVENRQVLSNQRLLSFALAITSDTGRSRACAAVQQPFLTPTGEHLLHGSGTGPLR
jgi:hypothetical protein